ncbi:hypothetical protein GCM10027418_06820 [Mariniluteicoccus endophyticus]
MGTQWVHSTGRLASGRPHALQPAFDPDRTLVRVSPQTTASPRTQAMPAYDPPPMPVVNPRLPEVDARGRFVRPWEVKASALCGAAAGVAVAAVVAGQLWGVTRGIHLFSPVTAEVARATRLDLVSWASMLLEGTSAAVLVVGALACLLVLIAFGLYAERVLNGRGRARFVALAALVLLVPLLAVSRVWAPLALVLAASSIVLAMLPRSGVWFGRRRVVAPPKR